MPQVLDPDKLLGGADKPGMQPRFPAGAGMLAGTFTSETALRQTGYGYVAIRYQSRFPGIIGSLTLREAIVEKETAEEILEDAKQRAPVWEGEPYFDDYGHHPGILRDSLYLDQVEGGWTVATDVHYAPFVEFGTVNMDAQPFLIPAAEEHRESFIAKMALSLQRL